MSQTVIVNATPGEYPATLNFSQGDTERVFYIKILDESGDYYFSSSDVIKLVGTKKSGLGFSVTGSRTGNLVEFASTAEMTDEAGHIPAEVRITNSGTGERIGSANIWIDIEPDPHPDSTIDGNADEIIPELTVLIRQIEADIDTADTKIATMETLASDTEAMAMGTRDSSPVSSSDAYYHNNAKYYKEQAASSATGAASSKTAADADALKAEGYAVGKQNGTDVASGTYYHNNAKYYKEQAASSAQTATQKASDASGSANTASQKATDASNSATAASGSANTASQKATAASGSASAAAADALKAEGYALGKQNGTDVGSSSTYYENNAKYYSDRAHADAEEVEELIHGLTVTGLWIDSEGYICF